MGAWKSITTTKQLGLALSKEQKQFAFRS